MTPFIFRWMMMSIQTLDIRDLRCPQALLAVKRGLAKMPVNTPVQLQICATELNGDVPKWMNRLGYQLVKTQHHQNHVQLDYIVERKN